MISDLWNKLVQSVRAPAKIALTEGAKQVLALAKTHGYQVSEDASQGSPAIVLEKDGAGKVHLWSGEDILEFGRVRKWI